MYKLIVLCALVATACAASGDAKNAKILRSESEIYPEGNYQWAYETENGISAQEQGELKGTGQDVGIVAQGVFQWPAPEGETIQIQYTADADGYHPVGNAIPTPPPPPVWLARALEWIAAHPSVEEPVRKYQV